MQTLWLYQAAKLAGKNGSLDQALEKLSRYFARESLGASSRPVTITTDKS